MRTYKEYYKLATKDKEKYLSSCGHEWWRLNEKNVDYLITKGTFLETTSIINVHDKNNSPIFINHSNVSNKEWNVLHLMLVQALIEWCVENNKTNLWELTFIFKKLISEKNEIMLQYYLKSNDNTIKYCNKSDRIDTFSEIIDDVQKEKFNELGGVLCDIIYEFFDVNFKNIPFECDTICFGMDAIYSSTEFGMWSPLSDSFLIVGNKNPDDIDFDEYVCLM